MQELWFLCSASCLMLIDFWYEVSWRQLERFSSYTADTSVTERQTDAWAKNNMSPNPKGGRHKYRVSKFIPYRVNPFSEENCEAGKQTGSQKSCFSCSKWRLNLKTYPFTSSLCNVYPLFPHFKIDIYSIIDQKLLGKVCMLYVLFTFQFIYIMLGPVVQRVVSLTSSLRVVSLTVLEDSIYNILIFFAEKMWVAFALQKLLTFIQQKISAYLHITRCKF